MEQDANTIANKQGNALLGLGIAMVIIIIIILGIILVQKPKNISPLPDTSNSVKVIFVSPQASSPNLQSATTSASTSPTSSAKINVQPSPTKEATSSSSR